MRHILLRFNYAVEIGARLAYLGHYRVTNDSRVLEIADEELNHREVCKAILSVYRLKPFWGFNLLFKVVGSTISFLCSFFPNSMLNLVANIMEAFAVVNYRKLAKLYPEYSYSFNVMADAEEKHKEYFSRKEVA